MRPSVQDAITTALRNSDDGLTLPQLKNRTDYHGHEVRAALTTLLHTDSPVYVTGVENRRRQYAIKDTD